MEVRAVDEHGRVPLGLVQDLLGGRHAEGVEEEARAEEELGIGGFALALPHELLHLCRRLLEAHEAREEAPELECVDVPVEDAGKDDSAAQVDDLGARLTVVSTAQWVTHPRRLLSLGVAAHKGDLVAVDDERVVQLVVVGRRGEDPSVLEHAHGE